MRIFFTFIITIISVYSANCQTSQNKVTTLFFNKVPDSVTQNTNSLSVYFKEKYSSDSDRIKAIFTWEATNIRYDVDNMFALTYNEGKAEKVTKALKTRLAICEGYAELFSEICNKAGIRTLVIEGYTRQKGMADYIPHAWAAANLYNKWYLFDPTWSSGYINNGKFINTFTYRYFKIQPNDLVKTHMPFDPMYQFLQHPLTAKDFIEGNFTLNTAGPLFSFEDTLVAHQRLSEIDQIKNTARRIEANGVRSSMIMQMLQYLKNKELNFYAELLNTASAKANNAVNTYNHYIEFKNKQFLPKKEDEEIVYMLTDAQQMIDSATQMIASVTTEDPNYKLSINQLNVHIGDLQKMLDDEKQFVQKYIKTKKLLRPLLFKKLG